MQKERKSMNKKNIIGFLLTIVLLTSFVNQIDLSVNKVTADVELPTPREETWIFAGSWIGDVIQNPLTIPYCCYTALCQAQAEYLWYFNHATGEEVFWLATGYEYSDDYMNFTIHIRSGAEWNDGEPFTSEDVKFTLELIGSNEQLVYNTWVNEWIESISTPDELTAILNLKKTNTRVDLEFRDGNWGELNWVPKHIWENVEQPQLVDVYGRGNYTVDCVFTGPYLFKQISEAAQMLVLERNENYWAKDVMGVFPQPKYIIYRGNQPSDIEYYEIVSGDSYDGGWFENLPTELLLTALQVQNSNLTYIEYLDPSPLTLYINCGKYPLSMPEVRWALSYAFDRESFCDAYPYYPGTIPLEYPWTSWGTMERYKYDDIFDQYKLEYNLTKAAEILDDLNFIDRNGDGIRETPNGTLLSWEAMVMDTAVPIFEGKMVQDMAEIGIQLTVSCPSYSIMEERCSVGDYDLFFWDYHPAIDSAYTGDITKLIESYRSVYYVPIGEALTVLLWARTQRFTNAELDTLAEQMLSVSPTDPEFEDLAHRAVELYMEQLPAISMVGTVRLEVWNTEYWTGQPTEENRYATGAPWSPQYRFIIDRVQSTGVTPAISYTYIWITDAVEAFTGVDARSYGPFEEGDYVQIPQDDADALVTQGLASYEYSVLGFTEILAAIADSSEDIAALQTTIAAQNSQITMLLAVVVVNMALTIVLLAFILMRKK